MPCGHSDFPLRPRTSGAGSQLFCWRSAALRAALPGFRQGVFFADGTPYRAFRRGSLCIGRPRGYHPALSRRRLAGRRSTPCLRCMVRPFILFPRQRRPGLLLHPTGACMAPVRQSKKSSTCCHGCFPSLRRIILYVIRLVNTHMQYFVCISRCRLQRVGFDGVHYI